MDGWELHNKVKLLYLSFLLIPPVAIFFFLEAT